MGNHDAVVDFGCGFARGLRDDRLIAFAVDHDLPFALTLIPPGFRVAYHGQAPLLEFMHRRIDMARDVVAQIFAHQTHEVIARITDMVFGLVLAPLHAHIAIDRIETLGNRATALDIRLLDANNF